MGLIVSNINNKPRPNIIEKKDKVEEHKILEKVTTPSNNNYIGKCDKVVSKVTYLK